MSFAAEKVFENRLVMLSGEEEALRRRALADLMALATAEGDFDLQTFEGDIGVPSEWIAAAGTAPFLSPRRTVIVRHLLRCDNIPPAKDLKGLPSTAFLILVADEEPANDDSRARRLGTLRRNWEKVVTDAGGALASFAVNPKQIKDAIKEEAARLGKKISEASAESLAEMTGSSLSRAIEELEKLAIYSGSESQIREADIRAVVIPSREWNVFKLIEAVIEGAVPEALRQLRILVGTQSKAEDAAFARILPMLSRQLRLTWQARLCFEARCTPEAPTDEVRACFPVKPDITVEKPYRQSHLMRQARRVNLSQIQCCMKAVSDADAKLKGQLDAFSPIETLESMVLDMVAVVGAAPAR